MTNFTKTKFSQGDVWVAQLFFLDDPRNFKKRLAIVASEVIDGDVLIIPVTSEHRRNEFDVPIKHWQHAGLVWPSIARTSKVRPVIKQQFVKKIGALHSEDLTEILEKCRTLFLLKS